MENIENKETYIRSRQRVMKARKFLKAVIWLLILILIGYGGYKLFRSGSTGSPPGTFFEAQSRDHISEGASHSEYNSNPPTGGWHYGQPAQTGIYDIELADEQIIHNLEHSHIWISYKPDLDKESIEKLVNLAKKYGPKIIMTPRSKNDSMVAITAWQYLEKFDTVDDISIEKMDKFIKYHRGVSGPENPLDFGFADFRGKPIPTLTPMSN